MGRQSVQVASFMGTLFAFVVIPVVQFSGTSPDLEIAPTLV
jgi:hypothetical protein